jgi:hypothetical protein
MLMHRPCLANPFGIDRCSQVLVGCIDETCGIGHVGDLIVDEASVQDLEKCRKAEVVFADLWVMGITERALMHDTEVVLGQTAVSMRKE